MIEVTLEMLKSIFRIRYNRSEAKEILLNEYIKAHEALFDEKILQVSTEAFVGNRPVKNLGLYNDLDIVHIRETYRKYIVYGEDIYKTGNWVLDDEKKGLWQMPPDELELHYYNEAKIRFQFLTWLKTFSDKNVYEYLTLEMVCKGTGEFNALMEWFITNEFVDSDTFVWRSDKTTLVNYLKILHVKGYTKKLVLAEIKTIIENSFGIEISIDTIKKAKGNPVNMLVIPAYKSY